MMELEKPELKALIVVKEDQDPEMVKEDQDPVMVKEDQDPVMVKEDQNPEMVMEAPWQQQRPLKHPRSHKEWLHSSS
ncbi:unnamed protein product, partial [Hymenolepis diminuta]|uniref:GAGE domain-containing protein n=1 Tax=Hymenolepis diminuta TaxID=6216 RepID=A0A0R3SZF2_HYMDI